MKGQIDEMSIGAPTTEDARVHTAPESTSAQFAIKLLNYK